jgi:hypothetical protein
MGYGERRHDKANIFKEILELREAHFEEIYKEDDKSKYN